MKAVVIIPTYNERESIEELIPIVEDEVFPKITNYEMAILVADDTSPDGTEKAVRNLMRKYKNLEISSGEKLGLGAAYVRGMNYAIEKMSADIVFEMDADLQHDPAKIPEFLKKIDEGYDMAIGTRYSEGGSIPAKWPLIRKIFSVFGNLLVRTIMMRFSIHDWTGGFRALKKEVFLKEHGELTEFKGYTFQVSFLHKALRDGFKIGEVPFHFGERKLGSSKIAPAAYIFNLLKYVIIARIKEIITGPFGKFLAVGGIGFIINAVLYEILVRSTHLPIAVCNIIAAQAAIFSNYNLNNLWTFKGEQSKTTISYFSKLAQFYLSSNIGVILIQSGTIQLGDMLFGEQLYRLYFVIGTAFLLVWNFSMYRFVIWRKK